MTTIVHPVLDSLADLLPADALIAEESALAEVSADLGDGLPIGAPLAVVYPRSTEEVVQIVRAAAAAGVPLVPQGARTGVVGGAVALDGSILVNMSHMDRILSIDVDSQLATVQPGVITGHLSEEASKVGLFYPPDPGSVHISTIGGNVSTNAGGMQCLKYGTTGRFIRRLTLVTGRGEAIEIGHVTAKGVAGLDLVSLVVGSEGTLGIITEITLALLPAPAPLTGAYGTFATMEDALAAANEIVASPYGPAALELMDGITVRAINALQGEEVLPPDTEAMLLVQSDTIDRAAADATRFAAIFRSHGAGRVVEATEPDAVTQMMELRRLLHPALRRLFGAVMSEDIAVPRARLLDLYAGIQDVAAETGAPISTGGHVGDGNLHPLIGYKPGDDESWHRARSAFDRIMSLAARLGGTITGEHGVGMLKLSVLDDEIPGPVRELQRAVKAAFDPQGILNPGRKY